tara:strand:- start:106744 stop:107610 length:867 start_codon:yes stop_codon:yes gene_type:complete
MSIVRIVIAFFALLSLTACVHHLSESECLHTNWQTVGEQDGTQGKPKKDFSGYIADCAKYNLTINTQSYNQGYAQGIKEYCTPTQALGLQAGQGGAPVAEIQARETACAAVHLSLSLKDFDIGYNKGITQYCTKAQGQQDAIAGKIASLACATKHITAYTDGYNAGAAQACSNVSTATELGKAGNAYPNECDVSKFPLFKKAYDHGVVLKQNIDNIQNQLDQVNSGVSNMENQYHFTLSPNGGVNYDSGKYPSGETTGSMLSLMAQYQDLRTQQTALQNKLKVAQAAT